MSKALRRTAAILLLMGISAVQAAPSIPPSELPGRERQRFQPSPLDRFNEPNTKQRTGPLWRWECRSKKARGARHRRSTSRRC
jgi:hypothetical protein